MSKFKYEKWDLLFKTNAKVRCSHDMAASLTIMIISFGTDRPWQILQTQIRLLLQEQSIQGLRCLPFYWHLLDIFFGKTSALWLNFRITSANILSSKDLRLVVVIVSTVCVYTFAGHGFLTVDDLKKVFSKVAPHIPIQAVHSAFRYGTFKSQDIGIICVQTFETAQKAPVLEPISDTPECSEMAIKTNCIFGK